MLRSDGGELELLSQLFLFLTGLVEKCLDNPIGSMYIHVWYISIYFPTFQN